MSTYLAVDAFWCGQGPGSGLSPLPGSPPHCPLLLSESLCWPEVGKPRGRRAKGQLWALGASGEGTEWGGCWVRSGLRTKASFGRSRVARRGRPGLAVCVAPHRLLPRAGGGGCWSERPSALLVLLLSQSKFFTERSWVPDRAGGDCGRLAAPGAHTIVGFPAPPT